jgi:hypothetical protein
MKETTYNLILEALSENKQVVIEYHSGNFILFTASNEDGSLFATKPSRTIKGSIKRGNSIYKYTKEYLMQWFNHYIIRQILVDDECLESSQQEDDNN